MLDEFGDMDPTVWTRVIRPMLTDKGREGWAIFIGTPKGKNAFHRFWADAENDPDWFRLELKASETKLLDAKELADARKLMSDDEYAQEYECSFEAAVRGAYWGKELNRAEEADGAVTSVPHDPRLAVHTAWDLGMAEFDGDLVHPGVRARDPGDRRAQGRRRRARMVCERGEEPAGAARPRLGQWVWGNHYLPHDVEVRELGTGKSRLEVLAGYGIGATICPNLPSRTASRRCAGCCRPAGSTRRNARPGSRRCACTGANMTRSAQEFRVRPLHDWTSAIMPTPSAISRSGTRSRPAFARRIKKRDLRWVV